MLALIAPYWQPPDASTEMYALPFELGAPFHQPTASEIEVSCARIRFVMTVLADAFLVRTHAAIVNQSGSFWDSNCRPPE